MACCYRDAVMLFGSETVHPYMEQVSELQHRRLRCMHFIEDLFLFLKCTILC